jgi:hypothetical protein
MAIGVDALTAAVWELLHGELDGQGPARAEDGTP